MFYSRLVFHKRMFCTMFLTHQRPVGFSEVGLAWGPLRLGLSGACRTRKWDSRFGVAPRRVARICPIPHSNGIVHVDPEIRVRTRQHWRGFGSFYGPFCVDEDRRLHINAINCRKIYCCGVTLWVCPSSLVSGGVWLLHFVRPPTHVSLLLLTTY
jgi:hypothetical protein